MLLLDGFLGGLLGAVIIGAAQIWSFQPGRKDARASQSVNAARELLAVVYQSIQVLKLLPHTDSAPGSPLSYGERLGRAQPMHDALAQALFVRVPLISDKELARRFREFARLCEHVAGPEVNAEDIYKVVATAEAYGDYVRASLAAHIDSQPLPTEQHPDIPVFNPSTPDRQLPGRQRRLAIRRSSNSSTSPPQRAASPLPQLWGCFGLPCVWQSPGSHDRSPVTGRQKSGRRTPVLNPFGRTGRLFHHLTCMSPGVPAAPANR